MASLAEIFGSMQEADLEKQAEHAEANGYVLIDEDTMEKAAHYDAIGRRLAHQVFEQAGDDLLKVAEGMGGGLPGLAAMMGKKKEGSSEDKGESEEGESKAEEKSESKADEESEEKKKERMAALSEKKAAVLQAMAEDDEYLQYIMEKYYGSSE